METKAKKTTTKTTTTAKKPASTGTKKTVVRRKTTTPKETVAPKEEPKKPTPEINIEGLESAIAEEQKVAKTPIEFTLEYLTENSPVFDPASVSSKFDSEKEDKVQESIQFFTEKYPDTNPLLVLLGKWWENKPARKAIKKMIDAEAKSKNIDKDIYLQKIIADEIAEQAKMQSAIGRLSYAITFHKPRKKDLTIYSQVSIDGELYKVGDNVLREAKQRFGEDKEAAKKYVIENSEKENIMEL
jgi:hypothetical protein